MRDHEMELIIAGVVLLAVAGVLLFNAIEAPDGPKQLVEHVTHDE